MYRTAHVKIEAGPQLTCNSPPELAIHAGDSCIVAASDMQEFGRVVKLEEREGELPAGREIPRMLRRATLQDQSKADENALLGKMAMKTCAAKAQKLGLQIRLVRGHYAFNRVALVVEFTCEDRVDIRELARQAGEELHIRVDMRQLGVRDEAAIIGGIGPCGRQLCCCTWLRSFSSINVRMAKTQGLSLNPAAIGGCCGRLKCCLNYEFEVYQELSKNLPAKGARVECGDGKGCVEDRDILRQRVRVCLDDERVIVYGADEVREIWNRKGRKRRSDDEDSGDERTESESAGETGTEDVRAKDAGRDHGRRQETRQETRR